MSVEKLTEVVRRFQDSTGEKALLVLLQDDEDRPLGLHYIGWEPAAGILVDGQPATLGFYRLLQAANIRPLQEPPRLLH